MRQTWWGFRMELLRTNRKMMKFILLLLTILGLTTALSPICRSELPPLKVCAYFGCFLNISQDDLEILNCSREQRGLGPLVFYSEGKCPALVVPKCKTFDY
nr:uncharacterized protein LOC6636505 [Drosophila virilis]